MQSHLNPSQKKLSFKQRDNRVKNTIKKLRLIGGVFLSGKNCAILICIGMFIKLYLISLPFFFIIDFIWLAFIARKFYLEQLGLLMKTNINWIAAITFYLLFIVGLVIFAIQPAIEKKSILSAIIMGGLVLGNTASPVNPPDAAVADKEVRSSRCSWPGSPT